MPVCDGREPESRSGGSTGCVISGGTIDDRFALSFLRAYGFIQNGPADMDSREDTGPCLRLIAADSGLLFCERHGIVPGYIVGDFDSAGAADPGFTARLKVYEQHGVTVHRYRPEKDLTDTQIAAQLAAELGWTSFTVLGGTGTRLDHVLGNLQVMELMAGQGVQMILEDPCNRIRMLTGENAELTVDGDPVMAAAGYARQYISLVPWGGPAEGVTLSGMKYPLLDGRLSTDQSLGISNERAGGSARISMKKGRLLVLETSDGPSGRS